jgi:hypothetical protein
MTSEFGFAAVAESPRATARQPADPTARRAHRRWRVYVVTGPRWVATTEGLVGAAEQTWSHLGVPHNKLLSEV